MKRFSLRGRQRPSTTPVQQQRQQWRAHDDGPISLNARPAIDSATGQRAFVLAFAAVAVAGAAYFATVMIAPENDPTSVVSRANANPQDTPPAAAIEPAPAQSEPVIEPAAAEAKPAPVVEPVRAAAADPTPSEPSADALPILPAPVRVKTVSVPVATPAPVAEAGEPPAVQTAEEPVTEEAATQIAAIDPVETTPPAAAEAYAADDTIVSEGVQAVLGVAIKERVAGSPVVARKKADNEQQVASTEPEMAGSSGAGTRRIRSGVNMRAAPKSGSQIIGTIPTNAAVTVAPGCRHWCAVSYNGKRGYIYKSFLR